MQNVKIHRKSVWWPCDAITPRRSPVCKQVTLWVRDGSLNAFVTETAFFLKLGSRFRYFYRLNYVNIYKIRPFERGATVGITVTLKEPETKRWVERPDWTDANAKARQFVELKSDICLEGTTAGQENMTTLTRQDLNFGQGKTAKWTRTEKVWTFSVALCCG